MKQLLILLKGIAMGAANVIPGVSGGTIALVTGIYERLIQAVGNFNLPTLKLLLKGDLKEFSKKNRFGNFIGIARRYWRGNCWISRLT